MTRRSQFGLSLIVGALAVHLALEHDAVISALVVVTGYGLTVWDAEKARPTPLQESSG